MIQPMQARNLKKGHHYDNILILRISRMHSNWNYHIIHVDLELIIIIIIVMRMNHDVYIYTELIACNAIKKLMTEKYTLYCNSYVHSV